MFHFKKITKIFLRNTQWLEKKQSSILSAALIITTANILSSLSGLVRERFLISAYFNTEASRMAYEALQVAFQIPDMLFQLIVIGALSAAFIPIFTKYKAKDEQEAFKISSSVINILLLVFALASLVVFIFSEQITAARTGGAFTAEQIRVAANLTRLMLLAQFFFAISNFLTGILQSYQRFIVPAIAPILYNFGIILGVFLFANQFGIYAAGLGVILGASLHMLVQLPFVFRLGFKFQFRFNFKHPGIKEIFSLIPPRVLTIGISELKNLALGFFATSIGNLSFVVIRLALKLMAIPIRLFGVPISQASLPFLSEETSLSQIKRFKSLVAQSINQIAFLAMPAGVLLLILRIPIVRLVFGAQNFPWQTTVMTSRVLAIIAISIGLQAMSQLLIRAFYALEDTVTPFIITSVSTVVYLFLSWLLVFVLKTSILGVAWATTITAVLETFLFFVLLEKKVRNLFFNREFILVQLKIICCSFLMAVFLYLPFRIFDELIFDTSKTIELIALTVTTSTIGLLVYVYFSVLLDVKELKLFASLLNRFGKGHKLLAKSKEVWIDTGADGEEI
jgi:putative peptidoglycan lipid II flippase